jgi:chromodomain-helicase-DNA-binding protein 4
LSVESAEVIETRPCKVSPLENIECFLAVTEASSSSRQLFIKWKGKSYMHCMWLDEEAILEVASRMEKAAGNVLRRKLDKFLSQKSNQASGLRRGDDEEEEEDQRVNGIDPQWLCVDRVISERSSSSSLSELLIKWKGLGYDHCTWEEESSLSSFRREILNFRERSAINSIELNASLDPSVSKFDKDQALVSGHAVDAADGGSGSRIFISTPPWLQGTLHGYQIEGLNWIYHKWAAGTSIILV